MRGEGQGEPGLGVLFDLVGLWVQVACRSFPRRPGDGCAGRDVGVFGMEQLVIDRDEVFAALRLGYRFEEFVPALRKDVSRAAVVIPVDLAATQEEDPA